MPTDLPCSVSLQPGPGDAGKVPTQHIQTVTLLEMTVAQVLYPQLVALQACGVDFEIKAYLANAALNPDEVIEKKYGPPQLKKHFFKLK